MVAFPTMPDVSNWPQIIADGAEKFMNGTIQIFVPNSGNPPTILYEGKARIQHVRRTEEVNGSYELNYYRNVRFQIPLEDSPDSIATGYRVRITNGGRDPDLVNTLYRIESIKNSSHAAVRTIETVGD